MYLGTKFFKDITKPVLNSLCYIALPFVGYRQPSKFCRPLIDNFWVPVEKTIRNYLVTKDRVCNESMGLCKSPVIRRISTEEAVYEILKDKPDHILQDDFV